MPQRVNNLTLCLEGQQCDAYDYCNRQHYNQDIRPPWNCISDSILESKKEIWNYLSNSKIVYFDEEKHHAFIVLLII